MIVIIIGVLLILSAMSDWASAEDFRISERNAEIRHRELMDRYAQAERTGRTTRRRFIKDKYGNILAEEVIVEGDFINEDEAEYE